MPIPIPTFSMLCTRPHSNMIHCFPYHQKAWGMRASNSLSIITIRIRAPAILTTHAKATIRQRDKSRYNVYYYTIMNKI